MMQEMLKGVGNNSAISIPTTLTSNITNNNNTTNNNNNDNNLESSSTRQKLRCPRCNSNNTKFCYYNNYNLTQPRHFCKSCRRYWTKGGTLRNVPIGGGCRKNNKSSNITPKSKSLLSTEMLLNSGNNNNNNNNPVGFLGPGLLGRVPHHSELQLAGPSPTRVCHSITQQTYSPILHMDLYSNGYSNQLVNEYGLFDENQRGVILGNLMTSSSSAANVRDILEGSRGTLASYGLKNNEISCWSQFS